MKLQKITKQELQTIDDVVIVRRKIKRAEEILDVLKKISDDKARELMKPGQSTETDNGTIRINKESEIISVEAIESILGPEFVYEETKKKVDKKKLELARNGKFGNVHPDQWKLLKEATKKKPGNIVINL